MQTRKKREARAQNNRSKIKSISKMKIFFREKSLFPLLFFRTALNKTIYLIYNWFCFGRHYYSIWGRERERDGWRKEISITDIYFCISSIEHEVRLARFVDKNFNSVASRLLVLSRMVSFFDLYSFIIKFR